jgi:hypothetical protein
MRTLDSRAKCEPRPKKGTCSLAINRRRCRRLDFCLDHCYEIQIIREVHSRELGWNEQKQHFIAHKYRTIDEVVLMTKIRKHSGYAVNDPKKLSKTNIPNTCASTRESCAQLLQRSWPVKSSCRASVASEKCKWHAFSQTLLHYCLKCCGEGGAIEL